MNNVDGFYFDCSSCKGKGYTPVLFYYRSQCDDCKGYGYVYVTEIIKVHKGDAKCRVIARSKHGGVGFRPSVIWIDAMS